MDKHKHHYISITTKPNIVIFITTISQLLEGRKYCGNGYCQSKREEIINDIFPKSLAPSILAKASKRGEIIFDIWIGCWGHEEVVNLRTSGT
jgi:hypothetical protein